MNKTMTVTRPDGSTFEVIVHGDSKTKLTNMITDAQRALGKA